ncbi:hypothetical protein LXL04_022234 [Taraxacum kok-saghyz]
MQRQSVPLSQSEKCIVGTGLEGQAALDSGALAIAEHEGKIIYTDTDKILLSGNGDTLRIPLVMYQRSNKNTCMHKKPQVQRGKCIKKGQILAYGAATVGGELALGKTVLVAYMPWEGYNFEDAVLISERLVYEDIYTSYLPILYRSTHHLKHQAWLTAGNSWWLSATHQIVLRYPGHLQSAGFLRIFSCITSKKDLDMNFSTGLILLFTVLGIVFHYLRKKQEEDDGEHNNSSLSSPKEDDQRKDSPSSLQDNQCRRFSLAEIKLATNDFDDELVIGKGGFGNVYRGKIDLRGGTDVAIKRLKLDSGQGAIEFQAEIEMLSKFRHSHIVSLLGYHEASDKREMIIVYEYMPNGSLEDHLHKKRVNGKNSSILTWVQRLQICIGAARGLDYLHTGTSIQSRVLHRDIKSSNILLDENFSAKISDFGLSRIGPANLVGTTNVFTDQIRGTFGYMDAEYFATHRLTRKSDVYAFGVVLLEVLCGRPALDFTLDEEKHSLTVWVKDCIKEGNIDQIIDPCLKGQTTSRCLKEFGKIAYDCILFRSKDRPTMTKVLARLEFVLALTLQKHGGVTVAQKMWSLFSVKIPAVHTIISRNRQKQGNDNNSKQPLLDKPAAILGKGSNDNINKSAKTEEPVMTKEGEVVKCHDATILLKAQPVSMGAGDLKIYTYDELRRATRNFRPSAMLGVSDGESIYKGWVDKASYSPSVSGVGIAVAIKIISADSAQNLKEWQAEVNRGKFSHPNLVKLLGYCSEDGKLFLVHEYIPKKNFIDIVRRDPLPWDKTMKIAIGVAKGLAFLHTHKSTHMFRTFSASNILLNEDNEPELYFGRAALGRIHGALPILMSNALTSRYYPPEYIATGQWYVKSDVYAFGVMMLDCMIVGLVFLDDKKCSSQQSLLEWAKPFLSDNKKLQKVMDPWMERGDPPKGASKAAELILSCLQIAQENRPTIKEIVAILQEINAMEM